MGYLPGFLNPGFVAVSKLGQTDLVFVQPGAKINSVYYCENVLEQCFAAGNLPHLEQRLRVQAGRSAMHAIHHTIAYLHSNVPEFIEPANWPPNSPDLNPADHSVWTAM